MNETSFSLSPALMRKLVLLETSLTIVALVFRNSPIIPRETILLALIPFSVLLSLVFINDLRKLPWNDKAFWYFALIVMPTLGHVVYVFRRKKWFETRPLNA